MIEVAFDELAIGVKYFDKFREEVERCYSELQRDCPEDDDALCGDKRTKKC
jgi:hypothetical protein